MSEFTEQEVAALKSGGGNAACRALYFAALKPNDALIPDSLNSDKATRDKKIRELIKAAYVDKRWMKREKTAKADSDEEDEDEVALQHARYEHILSLHTHTVCRMI